MSTKGLNADRAGSADPRSARIDFVDAQRGMAVALMVWMHTADGWLRPELKSGPIWEAIRSIGGLAAPSFFFLAGLGLGLGWRTTVAGARPDRVGGEVARGLQLVVLGYGLRLQMWMIDAGGLMSITAWAAAVPLACGYFALFRALGARPQNATSRWRWGAAGLGCAALGLALVAWLVPDRFRPLLRVDVLQGLGASLALVALAQRPLRRWPGLGVAAGVAIALLTPWVRSWVPGTLPVPVAGYLALWDAGPGKPAPTLFPLFPWMAYVPIGAFAGQLLATRADRGIARRSALRWSGLGAALALLCCEPLPLARAVVAELPWLTQAVRVCYRVGIVLVLAGVAVALTRPGVLFSGATVTMGRASLFVYWVHLEMAFGTLAGPIAKRLELSQWLLGFVLLLVVMAALARLWLGLRSRLLAPARSVPSDVGPSPA